LTCQARVYTIRHMATRKRLPALSKRPSTISDEEIAVFLRKSRGNISSAALAIGIHRTEVARRIDLSPMLLEVLAHERESMIDYAESALYKAVSEGHGWAICFLLKCLGKSRGYIERKEITGQDGKALQVQQLSVDQLSPQSLAEIKRVLSPPKN